MREHPYIYLTVRYTGLSILCSQVYQSGIHYSTVYYYIYKYRYTRQSGIPLLIIKYILQSGILRLYTRLSGIHTDHFAIQFSRCFAMPYKCIAIIIIPRMLYKVNR